MDIRIDSVTNTSPNSVPLSHRNKNHRRLAGWLPVLDVIRNYKTGKLLGGTIAGFARAAVALPVGMAYSQAAGNADLALSLAGMLAILSGVLCIVAGLAKLGFITELISKPIRYGYINGIAFIVIVGQLPAFFGFQATGQGFIQEVIAFGEGLLQGRAAGASQSNSPVHQLAMRDCHSGLQTLGT